MDRHNNSANEALRDVERKAGHHDTTVHEEVRPAVTQETVKPTKHQEIKTAIDKEVHQDHYHQTVQPVFGKEVLPEKHKHNVAAVENREFDNRNKDETSRFLASESGKLRDERHVTDTTHTTSRAPVVQGEHVHHHIHETVQPVLHKETIQPEVVHTTVPIHEGGVLGGGKERFDAFEGCAKGTHREGCGHAQGSGPARSGMSGITGIEQASSTNTGSGINRPAANQQTAHTTESTTTQHKKPSLMDKLNPMTDADGDGKKGFMS
ncbi:hypothetical protein B0T17DRAFT_525741 [Bombardia bombarda]|uniref:Allergen n=1 Tax=Bombardia bombarda TaxID=252184 RepID=A0AA40C9U9_9PEZI|nr:hypothetical protein B0T17DRAFT_525741 [Bombardia bombarda]